MPLAHGVAGDAVSGTAQADTDAVGVSPVVRQHGAQIPWGQLAFPFYPAKDEDAPKDVAGVWHAIRCAAGARGAARIRRPAM